jgi:hypothetical protein
VKWNRREIVLFKDIAERPETVTLCQALRTHHDFGGEGRRKRLIVKGVARVRRTIPLRIEEWQASHLFANGGRLLLHRVRRHVFELRRRIGSWFSERIGGVVVGSYEINRRLSPGAKFEELVNPLVVSGGGSSDFQARIYALDRPAVSRYILK